MGLGYELESGAGVLLLEDGTGIYLLEGSQPRIFGHTNLFREMPPMSGWPEPDRTAGSLERITTPSSSDYVLKTWDYAFEKRHFPCKTKDANPVQLFDDGGVQQSVTETVASGWTSSYFNDPVDNEELLDWEIRHDGTIYAKVRPWDGFFSLIYLDATGSALGVSYDVSKSFRHQRGYVDGTSTIDGKAANAPVPLVFADSTVLSGGDWVSIRFSRRSATETVWMARESAGAVTLYRSTNGGVSFSVFALVASGTKPSLCAFESGGFALYWIDGGNLKGQVRDNNGAIAVATFTVTACDDQGIAAYERVQDGRKVVILYVTGGDLYRRSSNEGVTFGAATLVEATAKKPAACCSRDGRVLECWVSGAKIRGRRLDNVGAVVNAIADWVGSGVDDGQIAVQWSSGSVGLQRAVLLYPSAGAIAQKVTTDGGLSWS